MISRKIDRLAERKVFSDTLEDSVVRDDRKMGITPTNIYPIYNIKN